MTKPQGHRCEYCLGVTSVPTGKGVKRVTLKQAIINHEASCPGLFRIQSKPKKGTP